MPFEASHTDVEASFLEKALAGRRTRARRGLWPEDTPGAAPDRIAELVGVDLGAEVGGENDALDRFLVVDFGARLPFEDGSFDLVYANFVIEHLDSPGTALCEWRRVLRPEGSLIPTAFSPRSSRSTILGRYPMSLKILA